jgi:uncharacterized protein (TIGR03118 family)
MKHPFAPKGKGLCILAVMLLALAWSFSTAFAATGYQQTNLVSDGFVKAITTDSNLKNPWGISFSATGPFWVSNNGTGVASLYNGSGQIQTLVVSIPPLAGGTAPSAPTGQVFNIFRSNNSFQLTSNNPAVFIFATEDGTISGWNGGTAAILKVDNSASGAVYKGLAIGNNITGDFLYAANFTGNRIDIFDSNFAPASLSGSFTDPNLPAGYAPFNIQNLGGQLFVTYAVQDGKDDKPGPGNGIVDVYDTSGNLVKRLISNGVLNSPWGLALAPDKFGEFSKDLLVGNFGDGKINAFDPVSGALLGTLTKPDGSDIVNDGLWGLIVGNGGNGGDMNTLYFTAGLNDEADGLFGSIASAPLPGSLVLLGSGLLGLAAARKKFLAAL